MNFSDEIFYSMRIKQERCGVFEKSNKIKELASWCKVDIDTNIRNICDDGIELGLEN